MLLNMLTNTVILFLILLVSLFLFTALSFRQGTYSKMTGNGYCKTISDRGKYGEYLTYKELKAFEKDGGKFLFNCYLPKADGATTEIDVMLIHSTGIFVMESKNYSGWIFGSEKNKTWTQTLRNGNRRVQKEHFYNPIMQNHTHIKWLKEIVGSNIPLYSVIAFSERCSLKDITVESPNVKVINRQHIHETVKQLGNRSIQSLSKMDIERIYEMLLPYTQTSEYEKLKHIENINAARHISKKSTAESDPDTKIITFESQKAQSENIPKKTAPKNQVTEMSIAKASPVSNTEPPKQDNKKICARCGAELVLRIAKKGEHAGEQFYGCSRFPKCRYKENI